MVSLDSGEHTKQDPSLHSEKPNHVGPWCCIGTAEGLFFFFLRRKEDLFLIEPQSLKKKTFF